jgi:hypothetical protein
VPVTVAAEPPREVIWRPVSSLDLDPQNPRLLTDENASQLEVLRYLLKAESLDELVGSFALNGYFSEEPVVIVPSELTKARFTVVEGNRRTATLKLLLDPELRRRLGLTDWPQLAPEQLGRLESIPTVLYATRAQVLAYLGFRHITGIKRWEPFQRSRYVAHLFESGQSLENIEESIGDIANTARRLYRSYVVFQQIANELHMDARPVQDSFSLLEVLLGQQSVKGFLGMSQRLPSVRVERIVPEDHLGQLGELVSWVFGDPARGESRIITDSRQINQRLGPVLADSDALVYLRQTRDLEAAYERSGGERAYLLRQLTNASRAIERAVGLAPLYNRDRDVRLAAERLQKLLDGMAALLE